MGIDCFHILSENLFLVSVSKVENDVVGVRFNGKSEELDVKFYAKLIQIFQRKSESPAHDEDFDRLVRA